MEKHWFNDSIVYDHNRSCAQMKPRLQTCHFEGRKGENASKWKYNSVVRKKCKNGEKLHLPHQRLCPNPMTTADLAFWRKEQKNVS